MTLYDEIYDKAFHLLKTKLPSFLAYHSPKHTAYVVEKAEFISRQENVSENDLFLIKLAALFHDIGFIRQYKDHEEAGCSITREILMGYSMDPFEINQICGMIMATKIPQTPTTLNEKIVTDADLEYLGTDLFIKVGQLLYKELHYLDPDLSIVDFNHMQIKFISAHSFHTDYCKRHREEKKRQNLQELIVSMK